MPHEPVTTKSFLNRYCACDNQVWYDMMTALTPVIDEVCKKYPNHSLLEIEAMIMGCVGSFFTEKRLTNGCKLRVAEKLAKREEQNANGR